MKPSPPRLALRFLRWFCRRDLLAYIEGDLMELYHERVSANGQKNANIRFVFDVILLFRPSMIQNAGGIHQLNHYGMIKSYFRMGWRNMLRNKGYSFINIGGLATGLAVVILISLWIYDELSFNKYHDNYDRIARVWVTHHFGNDASSQWSQPYPLANELRTQYQDFEYSSVTSWNYSHFIHYKDDRYSKDGMFVEPQFLRLISLKMKRGSLDALKDPRSIVITESLARTIFGNDDPIGKVVKLDVANDVTVTGVYEDIPLNNYFSGSLWLGNIDLFMNNYVRNPRALTHWGDFSYQTFVSLREGVSFEESTERIKNTIINKDERARESMPELFLQPMSRWHLYSTYENGVNTGGEITFVWLFGIIGSFVLLLACINFMNLSTARSESRAKEIGLRKTIGSYRGQLILQFLTESILVVSIAFVVAIVLVTLSLDTFNEWTNKEIVLPFESPVFWLTGLSFILITGLIAGSYPAFLLSSFNTVSILKGTFRLGWFSGFSRRTLVVVQFVVSVTLVIGTLTVYQQVQYAKDRPIGYDRDGLVTTYGYPFYDNPLHPNTYDGLRQQLFATGAVLNMAKSSSPTTSVFSMQSDFDWDGRDPQMMPNMAVVWTTHDYGKTIGMQVIDGRDFSRDFASDTAAIILNEAAVDYIGFTDPVGKTIRFNRSPFNVIGVVRDIPMESPYMPSRPAAYMIDYRRANIITMKLNPGRSAAENLVAIEPIFKKMRPDITFETQFVDDEFERKFQREERVGKLSLAFTVFAIFISCLGLFGLASFVAQRRTREIGIRKVSGASVFNVWSLLSRDFILLAIIACVLASPIAWYSMQQWLEQFDYRTPLSLWIYFATGVGAIAITLATVSYQAIRAAKANPVDSLRSE
ncbi:MAG TPA: ABC transporter permease [Cyclobacteriaceae bacterium]|nr:ABC transporter permease [Cyclobacteriaceae bacterium]